MILFFISLQKRFDLLHSEKNLFVTEFKRNNVIALHLAGKSQVAIVRALYHLKVNKSFICPAIACYRELAMLHRVQKVDEKTVTTPKSECQI